MRNLVLFLLLASAALAAEPAVRRDLPYAQPKNQRQTLDVYAPAAGDDAPAAAGDRPIVFWIHGGGWQHGDKAEAQHKPQAFVDKGFVFVSTNYRFIPDASIKQIAEDIAKAIRWTREHAQEYGGDPDRIFVMGHSAGAQLAALVCTDERYLKAEGLPLSIVKGCAPVDGDTFDMPAHIAEVEQKRADFFRRYFGDEQSQRDLSSVAHAAPGKSIPPFLILHVADHPETGGQSRRLAKDLEAAGVSAKVIAAEGKTHDTINSDLGLPGDKPSEEMWAFLDETLKKQTP